YCGVYRLVIRTLAASVRHPAGDVSEVDWRKCGSCGGGADRRAQRTSLASPWRWDRRSPRRANAFHLAGRRSSSVLDSDPQCLVTRKFCQKSPLAGSRAFGVARSDAGRMRCPAETLGEGKGERKAGKGRETATVEES